MTSFESPETNLVQLIERMIHARALDIHTATPGIISKYDSEKQTADVQVAIKRQVVKAKETVPVPIIKDVPVLFPRTGKVTHHFPLEKGDGVLLIFCERNIDPWQETDGSQPVNPSSSPRFHDFNDAVCLPGLFPVSRKQAFDTPAERDGVVIASDLMKVSLTSEGKILLSRSGQSPKSPVPLGDVLLDALTDVIAAIQELSKALQENPLGIGNMGAPVPISPALLKALTGTPATETEPAVAGVDSMLAAALEKYVTDTGTNVVSKNIFIERG